MTALAGVLALFLVLALGGLVLTTTRLRAARVGNAALQAELDDLRDPGTSSRGRLLSPERALRTLVDTAVRVRQQGVGGLVMSSIDDLSRWALENRSELDAMSAADGSVTLFFSDIEGSTTMNDELGDEGWVQLLIAHDAMVRAHVSRRGGIVVKTQGDGFMVAFPSPASAVKAGLDVQRSFSEARSRLLRRTPISVRIGVHCGPVVTRAGDLFGLNVAIAARVAAEARGGETLVTDEVRTALLESGVFGFGTARDAELKGVPGIRTLHPVSRRRTRA